MTKMQLGWMEMTGSDEEKKWKDACKHVFQGLLSLRFIGHTLDANLDWFAKEIQQQVTARDRPTERRWRTHAYNAKWIRELSRHPVVKVTYGQLMDGMAREQLGRISLYQFAVIVAWLQVDDNNWVDEAWFK